VRCWRVSRFASTLVAFAALLALAACGGNVPAPVGPPQFPFTGTNVPPPALIPAEKLPAPGSGPIKVALIVPLSGPNAQLGEAMLQAAQLALFATGSERLTLVPRDSVGTPAGAAGAARSAIAEGARLILGPLLAGEVEAVKPIAAAAKVNVIAFSTATPLAGGNVFLIGFLPSPEVVREVAFARERGLGRFAALAPNTQYGHLMADAMRDAVAASGGTVGKIEYFDPRGSDLAAAVQRLLSTGDAAAPAPVAPSPAAASPGFDALLLPIGGAQLKQIAHQLQAAGLDLTKTRLLGSGLWDDSSIAGEPALYGGWFAASPPAARDEFDRRFAATYGHPAPRLASLAFDAAALAAVLAKNISADPFSADAIRNPVGFTGVDGLFRFTPLGLVQRGLAVLEVGPQGNTVVSPAPQTFQNIGY
jgi:ABC-type branched-subunit amino acid transport system substrate-binding protein